jgi:PAS domain S-box-containing protein
VSPHTYDEDLARARASLRLSEERFRLLVESVKDYAIFMLDPRGVVASWNLGAERIKGYRATEIIGQHFSRFYPDEDVRSGKCEMELERATLDGRFEDENWRIRKDGSRFWANVVITVLRDTSGEVLGFAKVTRDLTERRAAEQERLRLGQAARAQMHVLAELSEALTSALSVDQVGQVVIEKATTHAHADICTLYLKDDVTLVLELSAARGCNPAVLERIRRIAPDSGNPSYAIGSGAADGVWIESAEEYAAYYPALAHLEADGQRARSFWAVPLVAEGRTIGILGVGFFEERSFGDGEREFARTFARQCAQALARARRLEAERVSAELAERLRASLATTLRSIGDALIATDAQGAITLMNSVAESLTGWSEVEARGLPLTHVFRIIHEYSREQAPNPVEKVLETGGVVGLANHTLLIARDGREIPIDDSGAPIRAGAGAIEGVVLVFRDVSERKREESRRSFLEEATSVLAESLDYERTVARVAELAVPRFADLCAVDLLVEGQGVPKRLAVAHFDPAKLALVRQLTARDPGTSEVQIGLQRVLQSGRPVLYPMISEAMLRERASDAAQLRLLRELAPRSVLIAPLSARGRTLGAISFVFAESRRSYGDDDLRFVEELAQRCANAIENSRAYSAEQQARRSADVANRAKDEFLAVVSHELRTPLNAIMGWAKLLSARKMDENLLTRAHETIERNAVAMAQLIEDLLDMSRVISGKLRIEVVEVDLARVVDAALDSVRPAVAAKGLELAASIDPALPPIAGDPTRLQQIVWNLLSNAVKFTAKGGKVEVLLRRNGGALEITVTDTGKGIAPDFLPHVFDAFRQEDAGPSRNRGGLGLGLAITKQLVELHGGQIAAHSGGENRGARFDVSLPISELGSQAKAQPPTVGFEKPEQIRGLRVLVVDDEEDARRLVSVILEDCGCRVTTAAGVEEALQSFRAARPDVLLSDISMPGENGFDLIRKIRALPRADGGEVPAAALTAYARAEDRRSLLNAGFSIHLPKPIEPAELVAVVATLSRFIAR